MHSFKTSTVAVAVAVFTCVARSQIEYNIDPESVPISTRTTWCQSQLNSCPLLCLQLPGESSTTAANDCEPQTLVFDCVCGNGASPNASEYSQTIPFFKCQEFGNQCVAACSGNTPCQSACREDNPCGAQDPTRVNVTTSSVMSSTTLPAGASSGTAGVVYTGLGGTPAETTAASSETKKNAADAALDLGRAYGLAMVLGGVFAGFALL